MASDVTNNEDLRGYRGLDVDNEDDKSNRSETDGEKSTTPIEKTAPSGEKSEVTVGSLQKVIQDQTSIIETLRKQLGKYTNDDDESTQNKKRKRDDAAFEMAMIADSSDKDIKIRTLTDENILLKEQLAAHTQKSTVGKQHRLLPNPPNSPTLIQELQSSIDERFVKMQEVIGRFIEEKLESKLGSANPEVSADAPRNYATAVRKDVEVNSFREIVAAAKNEERAEERERNSRMNNVIIHGYEEESDDSQPAKDKVFYSKFITDLTIGTAEAKSITRIGIKREGKNRPIKVTLYNTNDKEKIINNLRNLKDKGYKGISVTEDHTMTERNMIKDFAEKAKSANEKEGPEFDKVWVVRGSPKNYLYIKKVTKSKVKTTQAPATV